MTPPFFDVNKYKAEPDNPGAIHIPGTNVSLYVGGFAWLDVMADLNKIENPDQPVAPFNLGAGTDATFARAQYAGAVFQYFPSRRLMPRPAGARRSRSPWVGVDRAGQPPA